MASWDRRIVLILRVFAALLMLCLPASADFRLGGHGGSSALEIIFLPQSAGYIYPAAPGSLVGGLVATLSDGSSFDPAGLFALGSDPGCADLTIDQSTNSVLVGAANLTGSGTCLITASYGALAPVSALFTWNGTQQSIVSISPTTYTFAAPAGGGGATLGTPSVVMSGGIGFSAGGGTLALGVGSQCASLSYSAPTLSTAPSLTAGTYNCSLIATDANASNSGFTQAISAVGSAATIVSLNLSNMGFSASTPNAMVGTLSCTLSAGMCSATYSLISTGVDNTGASCNASSGADFAASGATLQTNPSGLAVGTYSNICVQAAVSGIGTFIQAFTLFGSAPGAVFSQTCKNIASATTPTIAGTTQVPCHFGVMLAPAAVPAGNVLVASVGGTPLTDYQIDSQQCSFWQDGSLRFCPFSGFVPQLMAGDSVPVQFTTAAGSFPTSSSVTPATIAAASDFKVKLTKMSASFVKQIGGGPAVWYGVFAGFHVSGGSISDGFVRNQPTGPGLLGYNCNTGGHCITPANYQTNTSITTPAGSAVLTFSTVQAPAQSQTGNPGQITVIDVTNPAAIPDNTTVLSTGGSTGAYTVTMSAAVPGGQSIPSTDLLEYGYTIQGGTSAGAFTVSINGSGVVTGANVIKPGAGFSLVGSGAMTAAIDTILNEYGSIVPPSCSNRPSSAAFTGTATGTSLSAAGVTGAISVGQAVNDGTHTAIVTAGTGPWTVSNGTLVSGAMTANVPMCVYTSGPTMFELKGFGAYVDNTSGNPDPWERFRFTIEHWTGPTGPYGIKVTITTDNSIWKDNQAFPNYTYDADALNGSTEVIGAAQGGAGNPWTAITQQLNGSWATLDPCAACATGASGRPIWLPMTSGTYSAANSQALAQVVVAPSPADAAFIHASHAAPPLDNSITPVPAVVTTATGSFGSPTYPNLYAPYTHGGMDGTPGFGSGGAGHYLGPLGGLWGAWYLCGANSCADGGVSYLQNVRISAESLPGVMEGPRYDDSGLPLNLFNTSTYTPPAAFAGDTPMWDAVLGNAHFPSSYPHLMWQGLPTVNQAMEVGLYGDTTHWPEFKRAIYLIEAERHDLDDWIDEAEPVALNAANNQTPHKSLSFGGTRYDAQLMYSNIHRQNSWSMNAIGPLAYLGPPNEPEIQYYKHVVDNSYAMNLAYYSFVGSGNFWSPINGAAIIPSFASGYSKSANGEPSGPEEGLPSTAFHMAQSQFMDYYWAMDTADVAGMLDNCATAATCAFAKTFLDNATVKNVAANSCGYNTSAYVWQWASSLAGNPLPGWDATSTSAPLRGNGPAGVGTTIHTEAGSSTISPSITTNVAEPHRFVPTATSAVAPGGTSIPLSSVTAWQGTVQSGWVVKDVTNPSALTWPTYVSGAPTGLNVPITPAVTGSGISLNDQIAISGMWPWTYPVQPGTGGVRMSSGARVMLANVNWRDEQSPNDTNTPGGTAMPWPPSSTPQVNEGDWDYLCLDAPPKVTGVWSTTNCSSPTPVTWAVTADFSHATVPNDSCPAASKGDWSNNTIPGEEETEMWPTIRWRQALNGVLGASADAATAQTNLNPWVAPLSSTYQNVGGSGAHPNWAGDNHF